MNITLSKLSFEDLSYEEFELDRTSSPIVLRLTDVTQATVKTMLYYDDDGVESFINIGEEKFKYLSYVDYWDHDGKLVMEIFLECVEANR